jgi:hypothetical protein
VPHLGDEGHFAGEEHGEYHYIEPEKDHHMGHYYSYEDDREHHPQTVDQHHDTHGIEHHPDDWLTHYGEHGDHGEFDRNDFADEQHMGHDFSQDDFSEHHEGSKLGDHHDDGSYVHDVEYHHGAELKRDIEHEFDELYHDLESRTQHGVEHHDIHYTTQHRSEQDAHPQEGTDFHASQHYQAPHHESHGFM